MIAAGKKEASISFEMVGAKTNIISEWGVRRMDKMIGVERVITGGKGSITQWVHAEYMEGSETICPTFIQWVRGGCFLKVPTNVPTG